MSSVPTDNFNELYRREKICTEAAMNQWRNSLKRPDMDEEARVRGAIEIYKRQAFAFFCMDMIGMKDDSDLSV